MNAQRKNLGSWLLYDLGNSFFVATIGGLFLAQWLILDNKIDDIWYGAGFAIATIMVLITSSSLGAWSDKIGKRIPFLKYATILLFIFNALMAIVAISPIPIFWRALVVFGLAIIVQYLYQISLLFYNSLLKTVSNEKNRGTISGLGEGFNCLGWLLAVIILLPFANGTITLIGDPGRHQVFLPAFIISTLLMLPMLFLFRESKLASGDKNLQDYKISGINTMTSIKRLFRSDRNIGIFLIAFSLISDVVLTFNLYFAVVLDSIYKVDDTMKTTLFAINLISTIIIGYIFGKIGDKFGHKKILLIACLILLIVSAGFYLLSSTWILYPVAIIGGAGIGGYFVLTRALMIKISPPKRLGEYFGLYSVFQRFASIIAPLVWGIITLLLKDRGELKYQVAGMAMVALLFIGTLMLSKVKTQETKNLGIL
ncbi:MAG: MFS transporter [Patescibacteria group bacterium]|nr:MFS transporter [Patescibacteria group bacterium]